MGALRALKMKKAARRLFLQFQAAGGLILWPGKNHEEKMPVFCIRRNT
jgi:hypothetical protein